MKFLLRNTLNLQINVGRAILFLIKNHFEEKHIWKIKSVLKFLFTFAPVAQLPTDAEQMFLN